ncbi:hypothetical protein V8C86DRAFT_2437697 [Haematococcus lacustris]
MYPGVGGRGSESTPITEEFRETYLVTCDFLVLCIDSETIYSHLSPRLLAALRGRQRRMMLMLTLEQRLGPCMTRARVEGVLGFLGHCEAVRGVEIRLIMDEHTAEEPTYEHLPVGAWLAERLMSNFPNCLLTGANSDLHAVDVNRLMNLVLQLDERQNRQVAYGQATWRAVTQLQEAGTGPQLRADAQAPPPKPAAPATKKVHAQARTTATRQQGTGPQLRPVAQEPPPQPAATATNKAKAPPRRPATRQQTASKPAAPATTTSAGRKRGKRGKQVDKSKKVKPA